MRNSNYIFDLSFSKDMCNTFTLLLYLHTKPPPHLEREDDLWSNMFEIAQLIKMFTYTFQVCIVYMYNQKK